MRLLFLIILSTLTAHGQALIQNALINNASVGAVAGGSVAWGNELGRTVETSSGVTTTITTTNAIPSGALSVVMAVWRNDAQQISTVTDTAGSSYSLVIKTNSGTGAAAYTIAYYTAPVPSGMASSSSINVNWSGAAFTYRIAWAGYVTGQNASPIDVSAGNWSFTSGSVTCPGTTAASSLALGGVIGLGTGGYSPAWTQVGATMTNGVPDVFMVIKKTVSAGLQDPAGSFGTSLTYGAVWVGLK